MKNKKIYFGFIAILLVISLFFYYNQSEEIKWEDKNANGIWDDLESYIEKNASTINQKKALESYFKMFQKILLHPELGTKLRNGETKDDIQEKALTCLGKMYRSEGLEPPVGRQDVIVNTYARTKAYIRFNGNASGGVFSGWNEEKLGNSCDFEVEK